MDTKGIAKGPWRPGAARHIRRSSDLSSLTSSAAHSRASAIFPASRKASAFARAWLSADRSGADSFPSRAGRVADDVLRIPARPDHSPEPSGCVSNLRSPSGSTIHGCALRVQKCSVGRSHEVSSSVPACTMQRSLGDGFECGSGPLQNHVPHSGQNHLIEARPLSAVRWIAIGSAPERLNASVVVTSPIENALPVRRWQSVQWQV